MAALRWDNKDPDEVLDYKVEWGDRLAEGDEIATSTWVVPSGITKGADSFDVPTSTCTVWLSGGTIGTTYSLVNRITTTGGRTHDQTCKLKVQTK